MWALMGLIWWRRDGKRAEELTRQAPCTAALWILWFNQVRRRVETVGEARGWVIQAAPTIDRCVWGQTTTKNGLGNGNELLPLLDPSPPKGSRVTSYVANEATPLSDSLSLSLSPFLSPFCSLNAQPHNVPINKRNEMPNEKRNEGNETKTRAKRWKWNEINVNRVVYNFYSCCVFVGN